MTKIRIKHAARGFVGAILLGVCLFALPLALYGAWDAWSEPIELLGKNRERTIAGRAAECFYIGAFIGGIAGSIAGVGVAASRLKK